MSDAALLNAIALLARDAGAAIMPFFHAETVATSTKDDPRRSQVTEADLAAEKIILAGLQKLTPDIPVVAEEEAAAGRSPDVSGGRFWLVDPLDGTKEFLKKVPEFTVNIGLIEDGKPVMGVVFSPASGDMYAGHVDTGAWMEMADQEREPMQVRPFPPEGIIVTLSRTYGQSTDVKRFLERYDVTKQVDAGSSIKFCLIARGDADVYPRYGGSMEWDTAAAHAVLRAAGGSVREINDGPELAYGKPEFRNTYFIAWGGVDD
ncbi:MAG: 3'(2'),5'-bisphosphate nucleotidase CysQ [Alphaproteobacteria bacterium]|jgi:3'(2'), 5'-bisphosphate nucleotidase